ncbi:serine hydrolase FSH [Aspergillus leporis]|uniref:Serine hydrolase FSH n=1 Tax=Aspergillus leporis TaxID=41062 RepID=A0A5N5X8R7_9EURO|nr:serine hydrolase FSH [Aspergillus leporis]
MSRVPSKALLCFHGTGSKGAIFNVQMARICFLLGDAFEFIFLDGPIECAAGPGVLPMFSGQEPYYCWFGGDGTTIEDSLKRINASVKLTVDGWQANHPDAEIVGAIGFSEGALALAMMLWQQQQGLVPWMPQLRFAVMSCCFFPNEASLWLNARAQAYGLSKAYINVPTLHIHGNRDFCLGRARKLVRNHYRSNFANVIQTNTAHHLPTRKDEVGEVVKHILRLSEISAIDTPN